MNLELGDEQAQIAQTVARALSSADGSVLGAPPAQVWAQLRELGIPTMRAGAARGGWASLFDALVACEAAGSQGRVELVTGPIAAFALLDRLGLWPTPVDDTAPLALALHDAASLPRQAVPGAAQAGRVLWRAGERLLLADCAAFPDAAPGPVATLDLAALAEGAQCLADGPQVGAAFAQAVNEYRLLLAAAQVGLARQALADAAAYATERVVFGKPIGTYQGVAHPLADALTGVDGAGLVTWRAAEAAASGDPAAGPLLAQACWWSQRSSLAAIKAAMRTFGGYGMTEDSRLPRYYRIARDCGLALGDPDDLLLHPPAAPVIAAPGPAGISFARGDEADAWAARAEAFIAGQFSAAEKARFAASLDNHFPELHQRLAAAGLLFPDWPVEHGGSGASPLATSAVRRVLGASGWPLSVLLVSDTIGKLLMRFGTEAAKAEILPRLARGEAIGCLGLSEPGGGSDVFGAKTRAVHDGAGWIANGQKVFTTSAHIASYVLLLTRTRVEDGAKPGGADGLTLFVAPLDRPGFTANPVQTFAGERTNITFYSDFPIDDRYLLAAPGDGARVLALALTLEHNMGDYYLAALENVLHDLRGDYAALLALPGLALRKARIDEALARAEAHATLLDCLSRRGQWAGEAGCAQRWFGPMGKLFGTEAWASVNADLVAAFAPYSVMSVAPALQAAEAEARRGIPATIYGGTNEIQRSIIAETALRLPRSR